MTTQDAYRQGFASGKRNAKSIRRQMETTLQGWRAGFPATADINLEQEILRLDAERIGNPPSLARFPETKGWPDIIRARRQGFRDGAGCSDAEVAFHFNAYYFTFCRLYTRYLGSAPNTGNCTAVFMRDSREGGPLYGRNWDMPNAAGLDLQPPRRGPDGVARLWCKGVSCATMCDEEPTELFPVNAWELLPEDCRKLQDVVAFLERYVEFWMPHNGIIVDEELECVAYEKTNCRIGWRYSDDGTAAVTACAQIIPEMKAHREYCHRRSLELRGYDESSPDWKYWSGAEARYHRLLGLVKEAAQRGPTLDDMANIVTDHAVPYPERICLAGESCHPDFQPGSGEWTMRSRAAVLSGPNRRTLFWRVEGSTPCYANPPFLIPGEGVAVKPEWQEGTRNPPPAVGPDDDMEMYRQYEFDFPNHYPL